MWSGKGPDSTDSTDSTVSNRIHHTTQEIT